MDRFSIWHWILFLLVFLLLLFRRGNIWELVRDVPQMVRHAWRDPLVAVAMFLFVVVVIVAAARAQEYLAQ